MKLQEITLPYVIQEVDYAALRQAIAQAFAEEYGVRTADNVRVAHFNPAIIDVTVVVQERQPKMDEFALALSEALRRQGVRVAIRITADGVETA
jgi:translation elongation factor EF-1beta